VLPASSVEATKIWGAQAAKRQPHPNRRSIDQVWANLDCQLAVTREKGFGIREPGLQDISWR
jgi:hypothetical protein